MIKLFTHNDLDGLGCAILASLFYGTENVDFETCRHEDINEKISNYIESGDYLNYAQCFITDIAVSDELATQISESPAKPQQPKLAEHFTLLDHHISVMELNAHSWCHIEDTDVNGIKCSGTTLFYRYALTHQLADESLLTKPLVATFVEKIRRYDTWDWAKHDDMEAKQLNDLLFLVGKERFTTYWTHRLLADTGEFGFDETQLLLLEIRQNEIDKYIETKDEDIVVKTILGYTAGVVFADRYQSELGNKLAQLHPELDFIAMINIAGGVSCRTIREDINLATDIAAIFGGGGHAKAAGLPVPNEIRELVINTLFNIDAE